MQPADNLVLARYLKTPPAGAPAEAALRGACGRAYYAAFAVARDALLAARITVPPTGRAHRRVPALLKQSADVDVASAGSLLEALRDTRNRADYDVGLQVGTGAPFDTKRASRAVFEADIIVQAIVAGRAADPRLSLPPGIT